MSSVLHACAAFFLYAVAAVFAQNAVFSRGIGISRTIELTGDDDTSTLLFAAELCLVCFLNAPLAWLLNHLVVGLSFAVLVRPLAYILCSTVVCGILWYALGKLDRMPYRDTLRDLLPTTGFNTCVAGTLLVTTTQNYTLAQSLGFGLGSGLGYLMAVLLVAEARRRLQDENVPKSFRGLPVVLVYIGILALCVYAFTGHTVTI